MEIKEINNRIFTVRGIQVMLDQDLAELYQVETRVLNQAVKRNINRFPDPFRFRLNQQEVEGLMKQREILTGNADSRSQIVIMNDSKSGRGQNIKYLPFVFTEHGGAIPSPVSMLSYRKSSKN